MYQGHLHIYSPFQVFINVAIEINPIAKISSNDTSSWSKGAKATEKDLDKDRQRSTMTVRWRRHLRYEAQK